jgi:DNA-binding transcriptional ArsR family regulator
VYHKALVACLAVSPGGSVTRAAWIIIAVLTFTLSIALPTGKALSPVPVEPEDPDEWDQYLETAEPYLETADEVDAATTTDPGMFMDPDIVAVPEEIPEEIPVDGGGTPTGTEIENPAPTPDEIPTTERIPIEMPDAASVAEVSPVAAVSSAIQVGAAVAAAAYLSDGPRWRDVAPLMALFSRLRRDRLLDHPVREMIYEEVRRHTGIHYRQLLRTLGVSNGTLSFHLRHLERGGFVRSVRLRGRKHFYATEREPGPEAYLVTDRQRQMLTLLRASPGASQRDIARELGMSWSNVSYHVAALRSLGLVKTERDGKLSRCFLRDL